MKYDSIATRGLAVLAVLVLPILVGCQNGFHQYYKSHITETYPPTVEVKVVAFETEGQLMEVISEGYQIIGHAGFWAREGYANEKQAIQKGKQVGANLVMVSSKYLDTQIEVIPRTTYIPGQSATVDTHSSYNTTSNAFTTGGNSRIHGTTSGSSTSYITTSGAYNTTMVPNSYARYEYNAYFLRAIDLSTLKLGVEGGTIDAELRKQLQTNAGCLVLLVYRGTPAFNADIIEGDVILAIDGTRVDGPDHLNTIVDEKESGSIVAFNVWRSGHINTINVTLR